MADFADVVPARVGIHCARTTPRRGRLAAHRAAVNVPHIRANDACCGGVAIRFPFPVRSAEGRR
ncbi:hypothetical protein [Dokdonella sp.]|uniref:hypothetical protein n=1 Tax=Dokdonella sp. TaxID=2291710 RepID=UPI001B2AF1A9|nr:hypothetical protein [Dokdonella sp.]MBO9663912.1 hypothetical protein [Dokdonella sp.]